MNTEKPKTTMRHLNDRKLDKNASDICTQLQEMLATDTPIKNDYAKQNPHPRPITNQTDCMQRITNHIPVSGDAINNIHVYTTIISQN